MDSHVTTHACPLPPIEVVPGYCIQSEENAQRKFAVSDTVEYMQVVSTVNRSDLDAVTPISGDCKARPIYLHHIPGHQETIEERLFVNSLGVPDNVFYKNSQGLSNRVIQEITAINVKSVQFRYTSSSPMDQKGYGHTGHINKWKEIPCSEQESQIEKSPFSSTDREKSVEISGRRSSGCVSTRDINTPIKRSDDADPYRNNENSSIQFTDEIHPVHPDSEFLLSDRLGTCPNKCVNQRNCKNLEVSSSHNGSYNTCHVNLQPEQIRCDFSQLHSWEKGRVSETFLALKKSPCIKGRQDLPLLKNGLGDSSDDFIKFCPASLSMRNIDRDKNDNSIIVRKCKVRVIRKAGQPTPPKSHNGLHLMHSTAKRKLAAALGARRKQQKQNALAQTQKFAEYNRRIETRLRIQEANMQWKAYAERPEVPKPTDRVRFASMATIRVIVEGHLNLFTRFRACLKKLHCLRGVSKQQNEFEYNLEEFQLKTALS